MNLTEVRTRIIMPDTLWELTILADENTKWVYNDVLDTHIEHGVLIINRLEGREAYGPGRWLEIALQQHAKR